MFVIGFVLLVILVWRISTSEQVIIEEDAPDSATIWAINGAESPFFQIETQLDDLGYRREMGELMSTWLLRIGRPELLPMLTTHNRWRFDPRGISVQDRKVLIDLVDEWLDQNVEAAT